MEAVKTSCCKSKIAPIKKAGAANCSMSFLSTALLILLPKCPLCVTAYMGAILMFFDVSNAQLAPYLLHGKPVLGSIIILMIILNNKGRKTAIATALAGSALAILLLRTYYYIELLPNLLLYVIFFFAIWYNGNFEYFYRFIRSRK